MRKMNHTERLGLLLRHLVEDQFRSAPTGVGLKTAINARENGLVEIDFQGRNAFYRLTEAGAKVRQG